PPPSSPLSPYTTLFRSDADVALGAADRHPLRRDHVQLVDIAAQGLAAVLVPGHVEADRQWPGGRAVGGAAPRSGHATPGLPQLRSEEHTSELQSPYDLV